MEPRLKKRDINASRLDNTALCTTYSASRGKNASVCLTCLLSFSIKQLACSLCIYRQANDWNKKPK